MRGRRLAAVALVAAAAAPTRAQVGEPLTLAESLQLMAARNPALAAARHRVEGAEARIVAASAAGKLQVEAGGGYLRLEDPPRLSFAGASLTLGRSNAAFADVSVRQPLYTGGAVDAATRGAAAARDAEVSGFEALLQETALAVHRAFYAVLLGRELVSVRRSSLEVLEAHLEDTRRRFREGEAPEFDVLRTEVELANQGPLLVEAENRLAAARDGLARLLDVDPDALPEVVGELPAAPPAPAADPPVPAARPERAAARAREEAAGATLAEARAAKRPTVSWLARLFVTTPEYFVAADADPALNGVAGVLVRFPVATGGARRARILEAEAVLAEAREISRDVDAQIALEEREARRRLAEGDALLAAQGTVLRQAEKALAIARVRYASGLGTQLEVTDAQLALAEARIVRLQALAERAVAAAELRRARGETLLAEEVGDEG